MADALKGRKALVYSATSVMHDVMRAAHRIAPSEATVLISGETGTGKEVMARTIHEHSARAQKPFVPMNCGAIPEALLESELFGHVRGAFTGAVAGRKGRLAMAEGGTLFLDEVGELPLALQVKLLRVLQERAYEPIGSNESVAANFRLIAATNRNLVEEVEAGRFRRDLYYRLMVCPLELPSLRERQDDIAPLFLHFWRDRGEERPLEPGVLELLTQYSWPGNVRELENLVERVSVVSEGPTVRVEDIPGPVRPGATFPRASVPPPVFSESAARQVLWHRPSPTPPPVAPPRESATAPRPLPSVPAFEAPLPPTAAFAPLPPPSAPFSMPRPSIPDPAFSAPTPAPSAGFPVDLPTLLRRLEDEYIDAALKQAQGNKKAAADLLGLQRTTLVEKLRRRNRDGTLVALPPEAEREPMVQEQVG